MRVLAAGYSNTGPRLAPPSPRFTTIVGRTYTIALQYAKGLLVKSRYSGKPEQMMYTLSSGEKAFFDLPVAEAIDSLTLAPGQPFTVCHRGGGSWDIERAAPPVPHPPLPPLPPLPPAAVAAPAQGREPAASAPRLQPASSASIHHTPVAEAPPEPATKLEHALKTAILAAANAERYASGIGYTVRFDADMITRQALTVLIGMEQGGRK